MTTQPKTRKRLSLLLAICMVLSMLPFHAVTVTAAGGSGTASDPLVISTSAELIAFASRVNGGETALCAELRADVTLNSSEAWTPIGSEGAPYTGTFDGKGYSIYGLYIPISTATNNYGLFGVISNATVKNLNVNGSIVLTASIPAKYDASNNLINSVMNVGGVVGMARNNSTVSRCASYVNITSQTTQKMTYIGGVVGCARTPEGTYTGQVILENCAYHGTINLGNANVNCAGGVIAYSSGALFVDNCVFRGSIKTTFTGAEQILGGILGYVNQPLFKGMTGCFSWGSIDKPSNSSLYAGAVFGVIQANSTASNIKNNCYVGSLLPCALNKKASTTPANAFIAVNSSQASTALIDLLRKGTAADGYYEIATARELFSFAALINSFDSTANGRLVSDIDLNPGYTFNADGTYTGGTSPTSWTPIGTKAAIKYAGTFDGNNKTVSGMYFSNTSINYVGLFGYTDSTATIKKVHVKNGYLSAGNGVGGICGNNFGTIESCSNTVTVDCPAETVNSGGICGVSVMGGKINSCLNQADISGGHRVGGICGFSNESAIENCLSTGTAKSRGCEYFENQSAVGSLCGLSTNATFVNNYYIAGTATDKEGAAHNGVGSEVSGTPTVDPTGVTTISSSEFPTGSACVKLSKNNPGKWFQNLGEDEMPVLDSTHKTAYFCDMTFDFYTNYSPATLSDGYYQIDSAEKLFWFATAVNMINLDINAILTKSIDLNPGFTFHSDGTYSGTGTPVQWTPIGLNDIREVYYSGIFDGNGCTVSGIYISSGGLYRGLFYRMDGTVKNLTVTNSYISGSQYIGGFAGKASGTIEKCAFSGTVKGSEYTGGICGANDGTIEECVFSGTVEGTYYVGGICGENYRRSTATVKNCRNSGNVTGAQNVGGICGDSYGAVLNCYNTGSVKGSSMRFGGVVGTVFAGSVSNSYYLEGSVTKGSTVVEVGVGEASSGTQSAVSSKTLTQFHSGEVTWLLNGSVDPTDSTTPVWYQNVSANEYPSFNSARGKVYSFEACRCDGTHKEPPQLFFTNSSSAADTRDVHSFANGICSVCGEYQPLTLVTASNYATLGLSADYVDYYLIENGGQLYRFAEEQKTNTAIKGVLKNDISLNQGYRFDFEADSELVKVTKNGTLIGYLGTGMKGTANIPGKWCSDTAGTAMSAPADLKCWTPIGKQTRYTGTFDGNGYSVSGLYFYGNDSTDSSSYAGLFGKTGSGAKIKNVSVNSSYIYGYRYLGGICADAYRSELTRCMNSAVICSPKEATVDIYAGGICGKESLSYISNCANVGVIVAKKYVGGLCASLENGTVENCYSAGIIKCDSDWGMIGAGLGTATITNCYYDASLGRDGNPGTKGKWESAFISGEITYLLNGSRSEGTTENPLIWYQKLSGSDADAVPSLNSARGTVYRGYTSYNSDGFGTSGYSNAVLPVSEYPPLTIVTASNYAALGLTSEHVGYYCIENAGQLYQFAREQKSNPSIQGVLTSDIDLNSSYSFEFEEASGLVRVTGDDRLFGYLGTGLKGTVVNTDTAIAAGEWCIDTAGTAWSAPGDLRSWTPIGKEAVYTGTFDGNGYSISGLYCSGNDLTDSSSYAGLFGKAGSGAKIKNVSIKNSYIFGYRYLGGVCGYMSESEVEHCMNSAIICSSAEATVKAFAGGICGEEASSTVLNCANTGRVFAGQYAGGICGSLTSGTVENCYGTGIVNGTDFYGAICGYSSGATVSNCYYIDTMTNDISTGTTAKSAEKFASGEVAYLLNGGNTDGAQVFYQNVDNGVTPKDKVPQFSGAAVYYFGGSYTNICDIGAKDPSVTTVDFDMRYVFTKALLVRSVDSICLCSNGFTLSGTPSFGTDVWGTGSIITSDSASSTPVDYRLIVMGDLNGDAVCDVFDCAVTEQIAGKHSTVSSMAEYAADINSNGEVGVDDYQQIVNSALNK